MNKQIDRNVKRMQNQVDDLYIELKECTCLVRRVEICASMNNLKESIESSLDLL